jgi:ribosomal protein S18 acetylase RimI-like enzyme
MLIRANDLEVRTITEDELDAILMVYSLSEDFLALGPESKASMDMVIKDLEISRNESGCFCGIYQPDGKMVGVVNFVPKDFDGEHGVSFISLLMIAAPFRRHGLGTKVVEMVEEEITNNFHPEMIRIAVQINNPGALRFWKRFGYRIIKGPELRPDQTTVYYLQKETSSKTPDVCSSN